MSSLQPSTWLRARWSGQDFAQGQELMLSSRPSMLCFPAINLSQLHKSANIKCWWELCKHNTCSGEFGGSLPFVHLLVLLVCFFKAVSELFHLPSTCDFSQYNHPATGSTLLCAIQDLCDGVSDVCGAGILYLTAEGQLVLCSQEDGTWRHDKICIRI